MLGTSHIIFVTVSTLMIILLPRYYINKKKEAKNILLFGITLLMLINHGMDFFREGYVLNDWRLGLPLHLCDFSSAAIILYFMTKKRDFFLFAFFAGISGAGMAILTPDVLYAFPDVDYVRHMIGHSMILLGVSYAMIIDIQRPYLGSYLFYQFCFYLCTQLIS